MGENSIDPDDTINMDEVPVNKTGVSSVIENNRPWENAFHLCSGVHGIGEKKLPPMMIFKAITMPKEQLPKGVVV